MPTRFILTCVLFAALVPVPARAALQVVTTTQDPAAITRAIGGERVKVTALAKGYQDPHYLEAKPSYMLQLHRADLVEVIGLDLEIGYIGALLRGARNDNIQPGQAGFLDLSQFVKPMEVIGMADRGQGDIHPNGNPHFWLDPENARLLARGIAARLSQLDPSGKATYEKNLAAFDNKLNDKEKQWTARMAPLSGKSIVTYHRSWTYFAKRYGFSVAEFVEPKPGIPPAPAHTLSLIKLMRQQGIKVILMENFYDKRAPELIADKAGAKLAVVPNSVGGEEGIDTYFDLIDRITGALAAAAAGS